MDISGIGKAGYLFGHETGKTKRNTADTGYCEAFGAERDYSVSENNNAARELSLQSIEDLYQKMKQTKKNITEKDQKEEDSKKEIKDNSAAESEEPKTDTDIIVKPDGSRVLMVTTSVGGMETTMSLELSKPTDLENGSNYGDAVDLELGSSGSAVGLMQGEVAGEF